MTDIEIICRYRIIEDQVIEYVETNYKYLPLIFVDGNSILLRSSDDGEVRQMTRPYIYHAKGAQKLLNFSAQTWANELENMVMHKWKVPKEGIPDEYADAYINNQIPTVMIYNAYMDNNPDKPLPPPMEIQRTPMPPEVMMAFNAMPQMMQTILGSFDVSMGKIPTNQISNMTMMDGITQSNATAMPQVVGFLQGLNQAAQIIVDLIPKYTNTPRTIPVRGIDGKINYQKVNHKGAVKLDYESHDLDVRVEAGVNFAIQQSRAIQNIEMLQRSSPEFAQFMASRGLKVLLKNVEFRGSDELEKEVEQWQKDIKDQQKAQQGQPNPIVAKIQNEQQKLQLEAQQNQVENQLEAAKVSIAKQDSDTKRMQVLANIEETQQAAAIDAARIHTEQTGQQVKLALDAADQHHQHSMDVHNQAHDHLHDKAQLAHDMIKTMNDSKEEKTAAT